MTDEKFRNKFRIPSARAAWYDYNGGTYFVTICTQNREHYFGKISYDQNNEAQMEYTEMGRYAEECIGQIGKLHNDVDVPLWVVMPNHIHLLVVVQRNTSETPSVQTATVETPSVETPSVETPSVETPSVETPSVKTPSVETPYYDVSTTNASIDEKNAVMQGIANQCGRLSHIISRFKSAVSKYAHKNGIYFQWQTRFHDHIVRDWDQLNRIADYIEHNPARWMQDTFYSATP